MIVRRMRLYKQIVDALHDLDKQRDKLLAINDTLRQVIEEIIPTIKPWLDSLTLWTVDLRPLFYGCPIVDLNLYGVNHLRDVAPLLRLLARIGYRRKQTLDIEEDNRRVFILNDTSSRTIHVCVWFGTESHCRFEIVGYEQVPKRKLVCQ